MNGNSRYNRVQCCPCCFGSDLNSYDGSSNSAGGAGSSRKSSVLRLSLLLMMCSVATILAVGLKIRSNYVLGVSKVTPPHWVLVGGLTSTGATFRLRSSTNTTSSSINATFIIRNVEQNKIAYIYNSTKGLDQVTASGLTPNTDYIYTWTTNNNNKEINGTFSTPAVEGTPFNFSIVAASCAFTGSQSSIFTEAAQAPTASGKKPLFVLHGGDFHYKDLSTTVLQDRVTAVDQVLQSSTQSALFQSTALVYMWDDHDWLGNDSTRQGESKNVIQVALQSYHELFPYYKPLPSQEANYYYSTGNNTNSNYTSPYHAFTIGTVRFIITDLVSENTGDRIFSSTQMDWLLNELALAPYFDYVVWLSTKPWIGPFEKNNSGWAGHIEERTQISNVIQEYISQQKQNLFVISGDSHMVAFDDGRNTDYSRNTSSSSTNATKYSFPILQTAPWDRFGSVKGGPYSHGCTAVLYERNTHYSVVDFIFTNTSSCIQIHSYGSAYKKIFSKTMCGNLFSPVVAEEPFISEEASQSCTAPPSLSTNTYMAYYASFILMFLFLLIACWSFSTCEATWLIVLALLYYLFSLGLALGIYWVLGINQIDTYYIGIILSIQMSIAVTFLTFQAYCTKRKDKDWTDVDEISSGSDIYPSRLH